MTTLFPCARVCVYVCLHMVVRAYVRCFQCMGERMCLHVCVGVALTAESQEAGVGDRCFTQVEHLETGQVF